MTMPIAELLLVSLLVGLGAALQGSVGIGLGLFGAPLVALVAPRLIPGPMLFSAMTLTLLMLARERRSVDLRGMGWALVGRVPGTFAGAWVVASLSGGWIDLVLGAMILLCVALSVARWRLQPTRATLVAAGLVSGTTGTAASVGGPPVALVYQHADGPRIRATLSGYFLVGTAFSLLTLAAVGRFGAPQLVDALQLLPAIVVGFLVSGRTRSIFDRGFTRPAVLSVSAAASLLVLLRGITRLLG